MSSTPPIRTFVNGSCRKSGTIDAEMTLQVDQAFEDISMAGGTHHIASYLALIKAALQAHKAGKKALHINSPANLTRKQVMGINAAGAQHLAVLKIVLEIVERELRVKVYF